MADPDVMSPKEKADDQICFRRTLRAFRDYEKSAITSMSLRLAEFEQLSDRHKELLGFDPRVFIGQQHQQAAKRNQQFLNAMCDAAEDLYYGYWPDAEVGPHDNTAVPTALDMDKVGSTLRQFVRDWSAAGAAEREQTYKPIWEYLEYAFPDRLQRGGVRVLVPGAGLCRLTVELASRGFWCQSNEFSYHMLIAGHFAQNHCQKEGEFLISPYCDTTANLPERGQQFAPVHIPDCVAVLRMQECEERGEPFGELSMVAGEFVEVYGRPAQAGAWSAVVTCFFIDTAHNIIEYLETMFRLLEPGGVWINVGPLHYHFADNVVLRDETFPVPVVSIELTLREVVAIATRVGFVIEVQPKAIESCYSNAPFTMRWTMYRCAFFVARKPVVVEEAR